MTEPGEVTQLLDAWRSGNQEAFDRLVSILYEDLRRIARAQARRQAPGRTLDTTALVHEAYLRLAGQTSPGWENRGHFLSVCARAMRQIVIDNARRRLAEKRGGADERVTFDEDRITDPEQAEWLLAVDEALGNLAAHDPRMARVVECRFFAGLGEEETARALGSSVRTVQRDWMKARAWLRDALGSEPAGRSGGGALH